MSKAQGTGIKKQNAAKKATQNPIINRLQALKSSDHAIIPANTISIQKPTNKMAIQKKLTKKSKKEEEPNKIVTSKSIGSLGTEPAKSTPKSKSMSSQPIQKTTQSKKQKASEKKECKTPSKIGEKKASGEFPEGKKLMRKILTKKVSRESLSSANSKTSKSSIAKRKDALARHSPVTTSKAPTASKKIKKKIALQKKESPGKHFKKVSSSERRKSSESSNLSENILSLSVSSISVRTATSIINLDLPRCSSVSIPKVDVNDHWGTTWKEGANYDPLHDDDFLMRVRAADRRVWKPCKYKKRVSVSPELSEIDEEPNQFLVYETLDRRKDRLKKRIPGHSKMGSRKSSKETIKF